MAEIGIDISGQHSKSVKEFLAKTRLSHVITVCKKVEGQCPTCFPFVKNLLSWPFEDPAAFDGTDEKKLQKFREVRDEIKEKVINFLAAYPK